MRFFFVLSLFSSVAAQAAISFVLETPRSISVAGGESAVVSLRFTNAAGLPAAGEAATFSNDACGRFSNGLFQQATVADSNGRVSATFTASNPPGITCWIRVAAGVIATVDVLTYRASEVQVQASVVPYEPRIGKPYTVRVKPGYGSYGLKNVDLDARSVAGAARVTPERANTGESGFADFEVTPGDSLDAYALEFAYRTQRTTFSMPVAAAPWQDMWWAGASEDGWGMSIVQHRDMLFAVMYAYDGAGKPTWFVIPGGSWNAARTEYTGAIYVPTGSPFHAYEPAKFLVGPSVGTAKIAFSGVSHAALDFTISGKAGHKDLVRNEFGPIDITVQKGAGDMWWGGQAQNGWGIAMLQQSKTLFSVWFTYDATGAPTWYVMPGGTWVTLETYEGRVFKATSSAWLGTAYDASRFKTTDVGSYRLRFANDAATFEYSVEGHSGTIPLTRNPF